MSTIASSYFSSSLTASSFVLGKVIVAGMMPVPYSLVGIVIPPVFSAELFIVNVPEPMPPGLSTPPFYSYTGNSGEYF